MQLQVKKWKLHHMKNRVILKLPIRKQKQCSVKYSSCYMFIKKDAHNSCYVVLDSPCRLLLNPHIQLHVKHLLPTDF